MSSKNRNLRLISAIAALGVLAVAASCRGFFVNPTLTSIVVSPPSPSIQTGSTNNTVQMHAVGTFNDNSTGSPPVTWTISPPQGIATISPGGLVTSVGTGSATVTATSNQNPSITGTQSVSVIVGCITSITLSPTNASISNGGTTSVPIKATAQTCNGPVDITSVATWTSSNTQIATVSAGVVTPTATTGADGTVSITASAGGIASAAATITVSGY